MIDQENTDDQFRITRVWAKNFRSIRELDLELGPLTVLVGPNASGKSNVMDVLRFISDALRSGLDDAIEDRGGIRSIRRRSQGRVGDIELGIEAELEDVYLEYAFVFNIRQGGGHRVKREYGTVRTTTYPRRTFGFDIKNGYLVRPKLRLQMSVKKSVSPPTYPTGVAFGNTDLLISGLRGLLLPLQDPDLFGGDEKRLRVFQKWADIEVHLHDCVTTQFFLMTYVCRGFHQTIFVSQKMEVI